ncbi:hypothetical protein [Corallococcus macrosporus]|nr:hypothetical protein [Corallococcus macrosporus]
MARRTRIIEGTWNRTSCDTEETYTVRLRYEDDGAHEHVLEPKDERAFLGWKKGQGARLTVTNLGSVEKVVPR